MARGRRRRHADRSWRRNCAKAASLFAAASGAVRAGRYLARIPAGRRGAAAAALPAHRDDGAGLDFSNGFTLPDSVREAHRVFFYPGSSIGNFTPEQAVSFLRGLRANRGSDGLLIGVDLVTTRCWMRLMTIRWRDGGINLNMLRH
jgi:uncharacterized SAM-dependent methyltransferase